jgi:thiamine transport system permease protein
MERSFTAMKRNSLTGETEARNILPSVPGIIFLTLFFFVPLTMILARAFISSEGRLSLIPLIRTITDGNTLRIIRFTLLQAFLSTLIALLMGLPGAYFLARTVFPGKRLLKSLSVVPFVLPPILVVLGFVSAFGNNGILNRFLMSVFNLNQAPVQILYSLPGIVMAHGFYNFPVILRIVTAHWEGIDYRQEYAARIMGASHFHLLRTIIIPQLLPAVLSSMLLVFLFCFSSFAVIMVLGGGPSTTTIEVEIYRLARTALDLNGAGRLALIAASMTLFPFLLFSGKGKRIPFFGNPLPESVGKSSTGFWKKAAAVSYGTSMFILVLLPLSGIVLNSFTAPSGPLGELHLSLRWYRELLSLSPTRGALPAIAGTLMLASLTLLIVLPVATAFTLAVVRSGKAVSRLLNMTAAMPMMVSSIILGAGYLALSAGFPSLSNSPLFIAAAHAAITFPFVFRSLVSVMYGIDGSYRKAAISLGASPAKAFTDIELPLLEPALFTAAAFAFALSVGEMNATLTLSGGKFPTLPIAVYRLIGSYQFHAAAALGTILMMLCGAAFYLIERKQ